MTCANRGIGQALAEETLNRDAKRVHAGTCVPLPHPYGHVTPLALDVTSAAQIQEAAKTVSVAQAFLPHRARSRGAIVNVLSASALAALPLIPTYSISKATACST